jgi:hypothetical protein
MDTEDPQDTGSITLKLISVSGYYGIELDLILADKTVFWII